MRHSTTILLTGIICYLSVSCTAISSVIVPGSSSNVKFTGAVSDAAPFNINVTFYGHNQFCVPDVWEDDTFAWGNGTCMGLQYPLPSPAFQNGYLFTFSIDATEQTFTYAVLDDTCQNPQNIITGKLGDCSINESLSYPFTVTLIPNPDHKPKQMLTESNEEQSPLL